MDGEQTEAELLAELTTSCEALTQENETLTKLLTADAGQAGFVAEIKRLTGVVRVLNERNAGLLEEKNTAVRALRKAELQLRKAGAK
jgi:hypothetical protein